MNEKLLFTGYISYRNFKTESKVVEEIDENNSTSQNTENKVEVNNSNTTNKNSFNFETKTV